MSFNYEIPKNWKEAFENQINSLMHAVKSKYPFSEIENDMRENSKKIYPENPNIDFNGTFDETDLYIFYVSFFILIKQLCLKVEMENSLEKRSFRHETELDIDHNYNNIISGIFSDIFSWSVYGSVSNTEDSKKDINNLNETIQKNFPILKEQIKHYFIEANLFDKEAALKYHHFEENNKQYLSSKFIVDIKKAYSNFIQTVKCNNEQSAFVIVLFVDYLNSIEIVKGVKNLIPQEIIEFSYAVVLLQKEAYVLTYYSDVIMNKIAYQKSNHYSFEDDRFDPDCQSREEAEEKFKSKNPEIYCLTFMEKSFEKLSDFFTNIYEEKYGNLKKLYEYTFETPFLNKSETYKHKKTYELISELSQRFNIDLSIYPGIVYCFSEITKYLSKDIILNFFTKQDLSIYKDELNKLENAMSITHEKWIVGDTPYISKIKNPAAQKEEDEKFRSRLTLFQGVFTFQIYALFSKRFNTNTFIFSESEGNDLTYFLRLIKETHLFALHQNYDDENKLKDLFCKLSELALFHDNFSHDFEFNFEKNSEELAKIIYYLSRNNDDNLHTLIDFINTVREKQLVVLPVVPDKFRSFTKEEADEYKKEIENNQQILKNEIDKGFNFYITQSISKIRLYNDYSTIERPMTIKTFTETDKKYRIYYSEKKDFKGNVYYKFDKKEDFRVTNKNHLYNHYIYSDRNVFTHQSADYMIIESLMDDDHAESLLYAFYDIKKFLNKTQNEINSSENAPKTGILLLQREFKHLSERMFKQIVFNPCKDYWKEVFDSKGNLNKEYSDRCKNLDYYHDFGPIFMKDLNSFLTKFYIASSFLEDLNVEIFFYLIVQTLKLEKYRK